MSQNESWTIGRLLNWTADHFKKRDLPSPRLDAELLLAHAVGCERISLYTQFEELVDEATRGRFRDLVKRRAEGTPVAYLLGRREFYSLNFKVTSDVLIPRPETEFAVIAVLDRLKQRLTDAPPAKIIDVGTGSGVIAITLAKHAPQAEITAVDISPAALAIAKDNAVSNHVADRIRFLESDLLSGVPVEQKYDFVVSNPPYVSQSEYESLLPEVRDYEPKLALLGGERGTEIVSRLIKESADRLAPGGWLVMEISPMIDVEVRETLANDGRWKSVETLKDLAQFARIVVGQIS